VSEKNAASERITHIAVGRDGRIDSSTHKFSPLLRIVAAPGPGSRMDKRPCMTPVTDGDCVAVVGSVVPSVIACRWPLISVATSS
jgi:hypothetical protein